MKLEEQIEKIVEANGAHLYDIETVTEFDEAIYRISIAKEGGVSLDLCADISSELSPFLDVNPPMHGQYRLEVSSPGIDRKLTKIKHFKQSIGEKIKFKVLGDGKNRGILIEADDSGIMVETKEGNKSYSYDQLGSVKIYMEW
ncbi:MAG: ribosome maturation factor RimP [Sulfurovum sp.]|nr:ribosome maturation factor RimP [Sulfurovum sp.]MCB4744465.1 ribosome maturation factor RimP [Sulfurovum sp.]MCB4745925.1 ribosome maturation factor RimP [Sulfurovum sp.]MCB4747740.1 ribosome maturation factor RimP [Sulfurovum sp.]MCB4748992.1 ribosome maturation factor RimP [Sulfurovum sp.]